MVVPWFSKPKIKEGSIPSTRSNNLDFLTMKISELIQKLQKIQNYDLEVMLSDCNGFKYHLDGPYESEVTKNDVDNVGDCEGMLGEKVIILSHD